MNVNFMRYNSDEQIGFCLYFPLLWHGSPRVCAPRDENVVLDCNTVDSRLSDVVMREEISD
jgi:hypothetical protein